MYYIQDKPNTLGAYAPPQSLKAKGLFEFPEEFIETFVQYNGFVILTVENKTVTDIKVNTDAWEKWKAEQTNKVQEVSEMEQLRADVDYIAIMMGVEL